jgi:short subunit fatty acids transporter
MTRSRPRPVLCCLMLIAFLLAIVLLSGCASGPVALHSWSDGRWEMIDFSDRCSVNCAI